VVNASAIASLDKARFGEPIGRIPRARIEEIVQGLIKLLDPAG
jgi:mRNA-degrading endonuclease toxin of MazEF toxin-antitoxin module